MKLEISEQLSTNSDLSNDSQISQSSSSDFNNTIHSNGNAARVPSTFISLDGLSSGVPTQTTPTLTPTTLRSIEQTFIELQSSESEQRDQAGFVPPIVIGSNQYIVSAVSPSDTELSNKSMWGNSDSSVGSVHMRPTPPVTPQDTFGSQQTTPRRSTGGRRPTKHVNMSPEEEERRNVRRERNKMAAARCRKRRMDHTNSLLEETDSLEQKKLALQTEIQQLQEERDELHFILETHRAICRMRSSGSESRPASPPDIKPIVFPLLDSNTMPLRVKTELDDSLGNDLVIDESLMFAEPEKKPLIINNNTSTLNAINTTQTSRANRPNSLMVPGSTNAYTPKTSTVETIAGIPITTPSAGIPFNFDSLMEGGTGLTPVSAPLVPSCSSQQRNGCTNMSANGDLITPDVSCPSKLVSL